jgi:phage terminase small subunit
MALNHKRQRFVEEYLVDLNATQAAVRAGYSPKTANEQAARLLAFDSVKKAVQEAMDKRSEDIGINQKYVLISIKDTIERCKSEESYQPAYVLKGSELLGKHLKMFTDKVEHTGAEGKDLIPETSDIELARRAAFLLSQAIIKKASEHA